MNKIKNARESSGLTQSQACQALGIPERTLQAWEQGKREPPTYVEGLVIREIQRVGALKRSDAILSPLSAIDYLLAHHKMCSEYHSCDSCPLSSYNNGLGSSCTDLARVDPWRSVRIVAEEVRKK